MGNGEEYSSSSRDRHHHHKKSSSRKRDDSEKEEKGDLRDRLNELKKSQRPSSSDRVNEKEQKSSSTHHRTKQVHDYEPYHKSSENISSAYSRGGSSSHQRSSHPNESRQKAYPPEKDNRTYKKESSSHLSESSRYQKVDHQKPLKPSKIIRDAEVNEIFSEEEDKTSESEAEKASVHSSNQSDNENKNQKSKKSTRRTKKSPRGSISNSGSESSDSSKSEDNKMSKKSEKSGTETPGSNDENMDENDLEAKLKAKLKEKFLKSQLEKKHKSSSRDQNTSNKKSPRTKSIDSSSAHQSRSPSVTNERESVKSYKDGSKSPHDSTPGSSKRTRNNIDEDDGANSHSSDGTEKFNLSKSNSILSRHSNESSVDSEQENNDIRKNKYKKRKSNESNKDETPSESEIMPEESDIDNENQSEKKSKKKSRSSRSISSTRSIEKVKENSEIEKSVKIDDMVNEIKEEMDEDESVEEMLRPTETVIYYCATQGCRSVEEFECLNKIEEGAYGVVYRAKDKKSNEVVALKRLKMEKEREGFPITSIREVDTLLKSQHVNVVTVREIVVGSNMDKIYMVMDYVEHDLKALMQHSMKKPFMMAEVKCLARQMLAGIAHLHDNWIIHRDLKTSNLLLSHKGVLKIADFGLAREYGSPLKEYTPVVVTLWYRCPELLLGTKKYSTSVDIWSVGTIIGELMLLKALFPGKNEKDQLDKIFKDLGTPNEKIWPGFQDLPLTKKMNFPSFPYNTLRSRFGKYLSDKGFELINKLLTYDPTRRISAEDALQHEFFRESPLPLDPEVFPTWPAKSEGVNKVKKVSDSEPRAPSAGKMYEQLLQDDNSFVLQFPAVSGGFTLR